MPTTTDVTTLWAAFGGCVVLSWVAFYNENGFAVTGWAAASLFALGHALDAQARRRRR